MANLRKIAQDETFSTKSEGKGKKYAVSFAVAPSGDDKKNGIRFAVDAVFDFTGMTDADLMELALRPSIIDTQRRFRVLYASDAKKALDAATWATVNVKADIVDAARAPQDPKARVLSGFAKLTPAEQKKMIAALQSAVDAAAKPAKNAA